MSDQNPTAAALTRVLASAYAVYQKTHGYHWNVRGPNFASLHQLFSDQYNEIWTALDDIAERVRALGVLAPQGGYGNLTPIKEGDPEKSADAMLEDLLESNLVLLEDIAAALTAAESAGDEATIDLMVQRTAAHQKHAWMLRASLGRV